MHSDVILNNFLYWECFQPLEVGSKTSLDKWTGRHKAPPWNSVWTVKHHIQLEAMGTSMQRFRPTETPRSLTGGLHLGVLLTCSATLAIFSTLSNAETLGKATTSTINRMYYHCAMKGRYNADARAYEITKPNLTFPQRSFVPWKLTGIKPASEIEQPSYDNVHAFADLGGDGIMENLTKLMAYEAKPNIPLPVMIWNERIDSRQGANEYGFGSRYGIELKYKNLSKILVGDLNGDAVDDLVFLEYGEHDYDGHRNLMGGAIDVALSNGSGAPYTVRRLETVDNNLWHHGVLVDVNKDGRLDIVAVGGNSPEYIKTHRANHIAVLVNDGDGEFQQEKFSGGRMPGALATAADDIDGDGTVDLVIGTVRDADSSASAVHIFWGDGSKTTTAKVKNWKKDPITDIAFADLNRDGTTDLALLVGGDSYRLNVIEAVYLSDKKVLGMETVLKHPPSGMFGQRFWGLGEITSCDNRLFVFSNAGNSIKAFFEVRPDGETEE